MDFNEEDDDYFIEDIVGKKNKKKKVNGKAKGNRVERSLAKLLTARFGEDFSRTVGSGARWSQATLPKHAQEIFSGDLIVPKGFKFALESKGGYEDIDLNAIFIKGNGTLNGFLSQATKDAERCDRKPLLLWKKDRKPWLAFIQEEELKDYKFKYQLIYGKWICVALEELLKLDDSFFKDENE